jgi:hypothetical protein
MLRPGRDRRGLTRGLVVRESCRLGARRSSSRERASSAVGADDRVRPLGQMPTSLALKVGYATRIDGTG